eukprot:2828304-Pleurochrysis_carterae.AAC.2
MWLRWHLRLKIERPREDRMNADLGGELACTNDGCARCGAARLVVHLAGTTSNLHRKHPSRRSIARVGSGEVGWGSSWELGACAYAPRCGWRLRLVLVLRALGQFPSGGMQRYGGGCVGTLARAGTTQLMHGRAK